MIETLGNATLTETGETFEPVQITGITFEDGDLRRSRYPTLIEDGRAPQGARFEPGFQVLSPGRTLQFVFQLDPGGGVELGQEVLPLSAPSLPPGLTVAWPDSFTCQLTLEGPLDKVTALRLPCLPSGRQATKEEAVYGGVYLAIVNREEKPFAWHGPMVSDPGEPEENTIKLLGLDGRGRPVYDLFLSEAQQRLPRDLALEPTFRVEGKEPPVSLSLLIATPPELDLRFQRAFAHPGEVEVNPFKPPVRPPELRDAERREEGRRCDLRWVAGQPRTDAGVVSTFYLEADWKPQGAAGDFLRRHGVSKVLVQVDPTVIQPPSCSGGICI